MEKFLDVEVVADYSEGVINKTTPQLINIKSIAKVKTSIYIGCCVIVTDDGKDSVVKGDYGHIRQRIGDLKHTDIRNCYVFKNGVATHYVPLDSVSDIRVGENTVVSLVVKTGDVLYTGMTFVDLRKTIIDINFGG